MIAEEKRQALGNVLTRARVRAAYRCAFLIGVGWLGLQATALAHVKWFSNFSFGNRPLSVSEVLSPTFFALAVLSMVTLAALVFLDRRLSGTAWFEQTSRWLEVRREQSLLVMRVGLGAVLLLSWQADAMLAPELTLGGVWVGWFQFALALMLLFRYTTPLSGGGLLLLYLCGVFQYGPMHMLDYALFVGVGYFLLVSNASDDRIRASRIPVLYATVGFSLCWVALEKLVYPEWALFLLEQHPQLTLGLEKNFFLVGAAFVEFNLGYLLIICLLQRPLALIITLVFFLTTLVFGKVEVIGHTMLHAILVAFVLEGPGPIYSAPITFHKRLGLRAAFAAVNFAVLLAFLLPLYARQARAVHEAYLSDSEASEGVIRLDESEEPPGVELVIHEDPITGWNIEVLTDGFRFAPDAVGAENRPGEGHAHLSLNGEKVDRVYGPWHYLGELKPGKYEVAVTLYSNDHREYRFRGEPVGARRELVVPRR